MSLFEPIFAALENGAVRYVIVGGMATVLHGYARLTADVDIIVDQTPDEARKAIRALAALGLSRVHP
jgi:tRNA nucleotidyltransferase/poly(A) polymerase